MKKYITTATLLLIGCYSTAQVWIINKALSYDMTTKKTYTDSPIVGSIEVVKDLQSLFFVQGKSISTYTFNNCEKTGENPLQYTLSWKGISSGAKDIKEVILTCWDTDTICDAKLYIKSDKASKLYYLSKADSPIIKDRDYAHFIDTSFASIHFDWVYAFENENQIFFINNVNKNKSYITNDISVWLKIQDKSMVYKSVTYKNVEIKAMWTFDCNSNKIMKGKYITYNNQGKVIFEGESDPIWEDVIPETNGELLFNKVCSMFNK